MYLWCSKCHHAHLRTDWMRIEAKHGVCPSCGSSAYRNAEAWETIAAVNNYPDHPDKSIKYPPHPLLF